FSPLAPRRAAVWGWLVTGRGHRVILRTTKNKVTKETTVAAPPSVLPSALPAYPDLPAALAGLQAFRTGLPACCTRRSPRLPRLSRGPGGRASLPPRAARLLPPPRGRAG